MARNIEREMFDEDENERFEGHFGIPLKSKGFKKALSRSDRAKKFEFLCPFS